MSAARWPVAPAAVALDLLAPDEQPLAERLIAQDPAFRAEVDRLRATTATLVGLDDDAWTPEAPPALDRGRTLAESDAAEAQTTTPATTPATTLRPRRRLALAVAGVAAAAVLGLVAIRATTDDGAIPPPPDTTLALRPLAGVPGRAQLVLNGAGTEAELKASGLKPSGPNDFYEAWLADDAGRMVSMGTFRVPPSGRVDVHMEVAVDVSRYALVDVSLEPDDGDPAHSTTSVLRARL